MRTVEDLRSALAAAGRDPDVVARAEEPAARVDGMTLLRRLPDGRCETTVWERGEERFARTWDSEQQAVEDLAPRALATPDPDDSRTEEQRRASAARMQAKATASLARVEAAQRSEDHG